MKIFDGVELRSSQVSYLAKALDIAGLIGKVTEATMAARDRRNGYARRPATSPLDDVLRQSGMEAPPLTDLLAKLLGGADLQQVAEVVSNAPEIAKVLGGLDLEGIANVVSNSPELAVVLQQLGLFGGGAPNQARPGGPSTGQGPAWSWPQPGAATPPFTGSRAPSSGEPRAPEQDPTAAPPHAAQPHAAPPRGEPPYAQQTPHAQQTPPPPHASYPYVEPRHTQYRAAPSWAAPGAPMPFVARHWAGASRRPSVSGVMGGSSRWSPRGRRDSLKSYRPEFAVDAVSREPRSSADVGPERVPMTDNSPVQGDSQCVSPEQRQPRREVAPFAALSERIERAEQSFDARLSRLEAQLSALQQQVDDLVRALRDPGPEAASTLHAEKSSSPKGTTLSVVVNDAQADDVTLEMDDLELECPCGDAAQDSDEPNEPSKLEAESQRASTAVEKTSAEASASTMRSEADAEGVGPSSRSAVDSTEGTAVDDDPPSTTSSLPFASSPAPTPFESALMLAAELGDAGSELYAPPANTGLALVQETSPAEERLSILERQIGDTARVCAQLREVVVTTRGVTPSGS